MGKVMIMVVTISWMTQAVIHGLDLVKSGITATTVVWAKDGGTIDGHTNLTLWSSVSLGEILEDGNLWDTESNTLLRDNYNQVNTRFIELIVT